MIFFVDGLLFVIAIVLGLIALRRSRTVLTDSMREGFWDFLKLIPVSYTHLTLPTILRV